MVDQASLAGETEMHERFLERKLANRAIRSVLLPIMEDVSVFPVFPEHFHVDAMRADIGKNALECAVGAFSDADQRAEHIEGY